MLPNKGLERTTRVGGARCAGNHQSLASPLNAVLSGPRGLRGMKASGLIQRMSFLALLLLGAARGGVAGERDGWFVRIGEAQAQDLLTLGMRGSYQVSRVGKGLAATSRGRFSRGGNLVLLSDDANRARAQFLLVNWGAHRYLIEHNRVASFCGFARRVRTQSPAVVPQMIFYRPMDENEAFPKQLPAVCQVSGSTQGHRSTHG